MNIDKLNQELNLLRASLEADIISEEEYEKSRKRIEAKIEELKKKEENSEAVVIAERKDEEEPKKEDEMHKKLISESEPSIKPEEKKEPERKTEEIEEKFVVYDIETDKKIAEAETHKKDKEKEEKSRISGRDIAIFLIIAAAIVLFVWMFNMGDNENNLGITDHEKPLCIKDIDCRMQGKIGRCLEDGSCEYLEDKEITITMINDKDCELCQDKRFRDTILEIFPKANIKETDISSEEGQSLVDELDINALPAYIFDKSVRDTINYERFKQALIEKEDKFIASNNAAGAVYYLKRPEVKKKIDAFVIKEDSEKFMDNIQEFLDNFNDIEFNLKEVEDYTVKIAELDINSYPVIIINNQYKITGIRSAESIKEIFCMLNEDEDCGKELSRDIK